MIVIGLGSITYLFLLEVNISIQVFSKLSKFKFITANDIDNLKSIITTIFEVMNSVFGKILILLLGIEYFKSILRLKNKDSLDQAKYYVSQFARKFVLFWLIFVMGIPNLAKFYFFIQKQLFIFSRNNIFTQLFEIKLNNIRVFENLSFPSELDRIVFQSYSTYYSFGFAFLCILFLMLYFLFRYSKPFAYKIIIEKFFKYFISFIFGLLVNFVFFGNKKWATIVTSIILAILLDELNFWNYLSRKFYPYLSKIGIK
jgi:hypothetical protein